MRDYIGEFAGQQFLARVRLLAFTSVTRAVIVHISSFLEFADHDASTMATADETCECEIVFHPSCFLLSAVIE